MSPSVCPLQVRPLRMRALGLIFVLALLRLYVIPHIVFFFSIPPFKVQQVALRFVTESPSVAHTLHPSVEQPGKSQRSQIVANMRAGSAIALCVFSFVCLSECAPPTCYSRSLSLSKEVMNLLDKIHTYHRTVCSPNCVALARFVVVVVSHLCCLRLFCQKTCAEVLPTIFLDVHVSCKTCMYTCAIYYRGYRTLWVQPPLNFSLKQKLEALRHNLKQGT